MRIIVISDTHGDPYAIRKVLELQPSASALIFLGDGERDMDYVLGMTGDMRVVMVKGNCDFASQLDSSSLQIFGGKRIFCTHGYIENVKYGLYTLIEKGSQYQADIILYGHTHVPVTEYIDGIYCFNPGSLREGNYGFIDITDAGIVCVNAKVVY